MDRLVVRKIFIFPAYMERLSLSALQHIQSEAIDHAREGITITDALRPDNPLIFVNPGFEAMTGYSAADVLGKNCRFLQGAADNQEGVRRIAAAIRAGESTQQEILNYRKDGSPFWNRLSITPILDASGRVTHFIGIQDDVTAHREKAALEAEIVRKALIAETTLDASERQRKETGRELHDNVSQLLALAMLQLNTAAGDEAGRLEKIGRSKEILREAIAEIRALSRRLVGPELDEPLETALNRMLEGLRESATFSVDISFGDGIDAALSPRRKLALYRVVQEQLHNIMKYARAKSVALHLTEEAAGVALSLRDDGVGFDPEAVSAGIGLQNMRGRMELEGGWLTVGSAPGAGCELRGWLPV